MFFFEFYIPLLLCSAGRVSPCTLGFRSPLFFLSTFVFFCSATISAGYFLFSSNSRTTFLGDESLL